MALNPMDTCASSYQNHTDVKQDSCGFLNAALQDPNLSGRWRETLVCWRSNTFNDSDVPIRTITQRG